MITDQSGHSKAGAVEKAHVEALCRMYHVIVVSVGAVAMILGPLTLQRVKVVGSFNAWKGTLAR